MGAEFPSLSSWSNSGSSPNRLTRKGMDQRQGRAIPRIPAPECAELRLSAPGFDLREHPFDFSVVGGFAQDQALARFEGGTVGGVDPIQHEDEHSSQLAHTL